MSDIDTKELAKAVRELARAHSESMGKLSEAVSSLSTNVRSLGNANAATEMGAIEGLGLAIREGLSDLSAAVGRIAHPPHGD
jgi:hypothetical protein